MYSRWIRIKNAAFLLWLAALVAGESAAAATLETRTEANSEARLPRTGMELRSWLQNMVWYHHFTLSEMETALGISQEDLALELRALRLSPATRPDPLEGAPLLVLPYPGGRHPRIGFLEGAIHPQRETKLSVFTPWDENSYVVIDVPEALWSNLGLTYLAHTHIPTIWSKEDVTLPQLEWRKRRDGTYFVERKLPNGIVFSTKAVPGRDAVRLEVKLTNGTTNTLSDLRVQMCAMLKGVEGFNAQTNANKVFASPFAACKSPEGDRWIIWGWQPAHRCWGNAPVPCLHSDPKFPDCKPGESKIVRGWLSFYEGKDLRGELQRIEQESWLLDTMKSGAF